MFLVGELGGIFGNDLTEQCRGIDGEELGAMNMGRSKEE